MLYGLNGPWNGLRIGRLALNTDDFWLLGREPGELLVFQQPTGVHYFSQPRSQTKFAWVPSMCPESM